MKNPFKPLVSKIKKERDSSIFQHLWIIILVIFVFVGVLITGVVAYAKSFDNKVLPGVHIGNIPVGGMSKDALIEIIQNRHYKNTNDGIVFSFEKEGLKDLVLYPGVLSDGNTFDFVELDTEAAANNIMSFGKKGGLIEKTFSVFKTRVTKPALLVHNIQLNEENILNAINDYIEDEHSVAKDASINVKTVTPLTYEVTSSSPGVEFQYDDIIERMYENLSRLESVNETISIEHTQANIAESDVFGIADKLPKIFEGDNIVMIYENPHTKRDETWQISKNDIRTWLTVKKVEEEKPYFVIDKERFLKFLDEKVAPKINVDPQDAKFEIKDGKVVEFQGSRPGVKVDTEETFSKVNKIVIDRSDSKDASSTIFIVTEVAEPNNKTEDVNDLGITEILGSGVSYFTGSPRNRVSNISNGVRKINGILIAPGEEFSALGLLEPFTLDAGYVAEKVIKGDEIKAEIGGGLCQIGTTLFRMAMNAGMEITERRNHSLVVSYYNDLQNGLPGTDATIYDPAPDFKFKNDTEHHILVQGEINGAQLTFTLWGKSDGRKGSYTAPVVHKWIPPGPVKNIETKKLAPGVKECQSAFTGANTSFTYTREFPGKEPIKEVFSSYYRPLPQICLVGVGEETAELSEDVVDSDDENIIESSEISVNTEENNSN